MQNSIKKRMILEMLSFDQWFGWESRQNRSTWLQILCPQNPSRHMAWVSVKRVLFLEHAIAPISGAAYVTSCSY